MDKHWDGLIAHLATLLRRTVFTAADGQELAPDQALGLWRDATLAVRSQRHTAFLIGNGASASMASHFAADLAKNGRLHTEVFSDLSLITAISNDLGYENVFSEPLKSHAAAGDMLVAISSSGRSPNILKAVHTATELGVRVVTLSGMAADNPLRTAGWLNIHVAAPTYGLAETCHAAILHWWMDSIA